jgi:cysteinyl-tRNA synthetase
MTQPLKLYNTLSRMKEVFEPLNAHHVGLYVCGPTVYGDAHLGHARPAVTFDVLVRYLRHIGYKVRYVRNITDVGHLENDADAGEDKIAKKARLEQLEPMEVAELYTHNYHNNMRELNILPPSIEPRATGHIIEQIEMIKQIMAHGYAYEVNGSVYFDVHKYKEKHNYGELSGRVLEDLEAGAGNERRTLEGQDEKRHPNDFALWKKAAPEHIMRWNSPWGEGFPGWHIECSAMSRKYLGETFDIHGGGMDLLFPHHECEIAQSKGATGHQPVRYWMHCNMITIGGQKMGKSLGNFITLDQFFKGEHQKLEQAYAPMTIRFFMLQAHYRSTVDFSNVALQAAEKGYQRLKAAFDSLQKLEYIENAAEFNQAEDEEVSKLLAELYEYMNDDLNTAEVISRLFELTKKINAYQNKQLSVSTLDKYTFELLKEKFTVFFDSVLGLNVSSASENKADLTPGLMDLILELRKQVRANKDFATSDKIRDALNALNIQVKDGKEGTTWNVN